MSEKKNTNPKRILLLAERDRLLDEIEKLDNLIDGNLDPKENSASIKEQVNKTFLSEKVWIG